MKLIRRNMGEGHSVIFFLWLTTFGLLHAQTDSASAAVTATVSTAQTVQSHPELCGRPGAAIPVPEGVRWQPPPPDDYTYTSTLFVRSRAGETKIDLGPSMDQICPVTGDQLVLFGEFNDNYYIYRIDRKSATIIDRIVGRDPMMSPDQHWLIMRPYRRFRSQRSSSEEYLLYDLTVGADENRMKGLTPFTGELGRVHTIKTFRC